MLRKLLAILVLITGLTALGQPAQALSIEVETVRSIEAGYACATQAGSRSSSPAAGKEKGEQPKVCPKPPRIVLIVPTVMLQADRARE